MRIYLLIVLVGVHYFKCLCKAIAEIVGCACLQSLAVVHESLYGIGGDCTCEFVALCLLTLKHSETKGMGSKTTEEPFRSQFTGKDSSLEGVQAVSGATISSKAYLGAIGDAFTAWEIAKGVA